MRARSRTPRGRYLSISSVLPHPVGPDLLRLATEVPGGPANHIFPSLVLDGSIVAIISVYFCHSWGMTTFLKLRESRVVRV